METVLFSLACSHAKAKPYMTKDHLTKFINQKQRDPRLNTLLFPPARPDQVQGLIDKYEPSGINVQRGEAQWKPSAPVGLSCSDTWAVALIVIPCSPGQLSPQGMVWFLCGPENSVLVQDKLLVHHDMTQPLNHYFINSSHNTYLTGGPSPPHY